MKKGICLFLFFCATLFVACVDDAAEPEPVRPSFLKIVFSGFHEESVDSSRRIIRIAPDRAWMDSLVVEKAETVGGARLFLTEDADLISPELGAELLAGTIISIRDTANFSFVVLDSLNRIVAVWRVLWEFPKSSSGAESSSSGAESSSSGSEPSSSQGFLESSSSAEIMENSSSSVAYPQLSELSADGGTVSVSGERIYVELPYPSDLSRVSLFPMDSVLDLRREVEMAFLDSAGNKFTYKVIAGSQIPGSDFNAREDAFWATTSDAMGKKGSAKVLGTPYTFTSSENLAENGSSLTLSTKEVVCAWGPIAIDGGWKTASGFYFAGSYSGKDARDIYDRNYSSGTPSTDASDISLDMTFGKPFTGRPVAFELSYAYSHVANKNKDFPQKSLAYVVLLSADNKAVAVGMLSDSASVEQATKTVPLSYGADPDGLLTGGYAGLSDVSLGTGEEDVESIRVLFASSAYAHVVAGGLAGNAEKYRGGENSSLTLENFRLVY